ncbi:hypothetical protein IQ07DRAFT_160245 [Pyrenochaeta sp. DS3sAY3a]|nr:hypothetical protein IQ07DRAFT_160245 [Pyrenochaeta sp. DS3sAY3a]
MMTFYGHDTMVVCSAVFTLVAFIHEHHHAHVSYVIFFVVFLLFCSLVNSVSAIHCPFLLRSQINLFAKIRLFHIFASACRRFSRKLRYDEQLPNVLSLLS